MSKLVKKIHVIYELCSTFPRLLVLCNAVSDSYKFEKNTFKMKQIFGNVVRIPVITIS